VEKADSNGFWTSRYAGIIKNKHEVIHFMPPVFDWWYLIEKEN